MEKKNADHIVTVPENITVPENPAPVKVDTPKVTAKREMAVNTETAPKINFDTLLALGIVDADAKGKYKSKSAIDNARKYLHSANAELADKITDNALAILLESVGRNTEQASKAGKRVSLALALIDANKTYTDYGYKSTSALMRALYPHFADSTVWNYINVGKEIYLPATKPDAPAYLKEIATLEPGTALSAVGALRDENARKRLPGALKKAKEEKGGKLTQTVLKAAAKAARNPDHGKKEDGTKGTERKDAKAQAELKANAWSDIVSRAFDFESAGGERYIYMYETKVRFAKDALSIAMSKESEALAFVKALYEHIRF